MRTLSDATLLAWIAGALDPGRASEVAEDVAANADLQARVHLLGLQLAEPPTPAFRLPPPSFSAFGVSRDLEIVMGDPTLRPGDRFRLLLDRPDDRPRWVVVLSRVDRQWTVVFPESPEDLIGLEELADSGARRVLDLVVADPGRQRWAVALPEQSLSIRWDESKPEKRWEALRSGLLSGTIPAVTVDLEVLAA